MEEVLAAQVASTTGVPDHLRDLFLARVRGSATAAARAVDVVAIVAGVPRTSRRRGTRSRPRHGRIRLRSSGRGRRPRHRQQGLSDAPRATAGGDLLDPLHGRAVVTFTAASPRRSPPHHIRTRQHWLTTGTRPDEPAAAALANLEARHSPPAGTRPVKGSPIWSAFLSTSTRCRRIARRPRAGAQRCWPRAAEAAYLSGGFERAVALGGGVHPAPEGTGPRVRALGAAGAVPIGQPERRWAAEAYERSVATLAADARVAVRARVLSGYAWYPIDSEPDRRCEELGRSRLLRQPRKAPTH